MKTVRKICPPKIDCWAYENGGCKILTETVCERSLKCGHYKAQAQFDADKKKADERIERLGIKNNRVSGN